MRNYLIASFTVFALTIGTMYQSIAPTTPQAEEETETPPNQTFKANAYYENVGEFRKLSETIRKDTAVTFFIDFADMDIEDSMSDENGNQNISWSSNTENIEIYTESGVITSIRETDEEGKVLKVYFKK